MWDGPSVHAERICVAAGTLRVSFVAVGQNLAKSGRKVFNLVLRILDDKLWFQKRFDSGRSTDDRGLFGPGNSGYEFIPKARDDCIVRDTLLERPCQCLNDI